MHKDRLSRPLRPIEGGYSPSLPSSGRGDPLHPVFLTDDRMRSAGHGAVPLRGEHVHFLPVFPQGSPVSL